MHLFDKLCVRYEWQNGAIKSFGTQKSMSDPQMSNIELVYTFVGFLFICFVPGVFCLFILGFCFVCFFGGFFCCYCLFWDILGGCCFVLIVIIPCSFFKKIRKFKVYFGFYMSPVKRLRIF